MTNTPPLKAHLQPFATLTDAELVGRVVQGDHPLFELIMRRYNRRLFRVAWGVLKDNALAQDAIQEGYLLAFGRLSQFSGPIGLGAWLSKIVFHEALRLLKKDQRLELVQAPEAVAEGSEPDLATENQESAQLIEAAVASLPRDYRLVFILREIEELSIEETASCLELNTGTVKSRLHRAKQALQKTLSKQSKIGSEPFPFAGARCDSIVNNVFIQLNENRIN